MRTSKKQPEIAVVYLCRDLEDQGYLDTFLANYAKFRAGIDHHLVILLKGNTRESTNLTKFMQKHGDTVSVLKVPDEGFDIGSYLFSAKKLQYRILCFLNTYSKIMANNWLRFLAEPVSERKAGMTGCTGSWESFSTTMLEEGLPVAVDGWNNFPQRLDDFPRFPNPHLRTTAFCIERKLLLSLEIPVPKEKIDCWLIESGSYSITRQIHRKQLEVLLVGRNGKTYIPRLWSAAETFRVPGQSNLLVADNQTENYQRFSKDYQLKVTASTWLPLQSRDKSIQVALLIGRGSVSARLKHSLKHVIKQRFPTMYGWLRDTYKRAKKG